MSELTKHSDELSPVKRTLFALETMRAKVEALEKAKTESIAIIGISCRFPGGANDPESYWQLLHEGRDAITEVPPERWDIDAFYNPDPDAPGKMYTRWGGFLDQVDQFDPTFFGISPREAVTMDPQQRLLLELCWEALERAGQAPDKLVGSRAGVFLGITSTDYAMVGKTDYDLSQVDVYSGMGAGLNVASGRLSYLLGLQGPNFPVDTACSSSLVATQLACESLRNDDCSMALVGGVNLILSPAGNIFFSKMRAMATDGRCKTFDARADGYVRGEGGGVIVLKRLSDAQAAGNPILALIRGTAVNHNGHSNGLTAPNGRAQEVVIRRALSTARIKPNQISYVEAHGTGTSLGDPIEMRALAAVLGEERPTNTPFFVGSVKTNIGHLEAAAGMAGLIKVVLALQHEELPPHLHLQERNPYIAWDEIPVTIPTTNTSWPRQPGKPRYAGVSSFGFSGTNAHVILEEAPTTQMPTESAEVGPGQSYLLPISARSLPALQAYAESYAHWLHTHPEVSVYDIVATASLHRSHFEHRIALIGDSVSALEEQAHSFLRGELSAGVARSTRRRKIVFVCPGQGSQWQGMGRYLLAHEAIFREQMQRCDEALRPYINCSLLDQFQQGTDWQDIAMVQPALFAMQLSLASLWNSWGVKPDAVIGHSMGEIASACLAGILSLEDGARLISRRSRLLTRIRGKGAMMLVELTQEQAEQAISGYEAQVSIAVSNSPGSTVLAGEPWALEQISNRLQQEEVFWRKIKVDVASHSPQVEALRADLLQIGLELQPREEQIGFYSTVKGQRVPGKELDATYWVSNLREPVRFASTIQRMLSDGYDTFIELSPHPLLTAALQETIELTEQTEHLTTGRECVVVASLRREENERAVLLQALGTLYTHGVTVDWSVLYPQNSSCIILPTYPFQRTHYWVDLPSDRPAGAATYMRRSYSPSCAIHPILGAPIEPAHTPGTLIWEGTLDQQTLPYLYAHRLQNVAVLSVTAYLELVLGAATAAFHSDPDLTTNEQYVLSDTLLHRALFVAETTPPFIQLTLRSQDAHHSTWSVHSRMHERWVLHANGSIAGVQAFTDVVANTWEQHRREIQQTKSTQAISGRAYYQTMEQLHVQYVSPLRTIEQLWYNDSEALGEIQLVERVASKNSPTSWSQQAICIDACLQLALAAMMGKIIPSTGENLTNEVSFSTTSAEGLTAEASDPVSAKEDTSIVMPAAIAEVRVSRLVEQKLQGQAQIKHLETSVSANTLSYLPLEGQSLLYNLAGQKLVEVKGLRFALPGSDILSAQSGQVEQWLYKIVWEKIAAVSSQNRESTPTTVALSAATHHEKEAQPSLLSGSWLILTDNGGIGSALADLLQAQGARCVLVNAGTNYAHLVDDTYVVDPTLPEQIMQLFDTVLGNGQPACRGIVHLWSLAQDSQFTSIETSLSSLRDSEDLGCGSAIALVQALNNRALDADAQPLIWLITSGAHHIEGDLAHMNTAGLLQVPLWGLGHVLAEEHRELFGGLVDLDPTASALTSAQALYDLLVLPDNTEHQSVLRAGYRYGARLVRTQTPQSQVQPLSWRVDGTYLLTGGLGALGREVARWLVGQGARRLLLLNRTSLPPRSQWKSIPTDSPQAAQVATIKELEAQGATIEVAAVDIADAQQLQTFLRNYAEEDKPAIRGVLHLAGVLEDRLLVQLERSALDTVWRPKVVGGWLLHTLLRDTPLDFFIAFSSMGSLIGSPGQGNYAAANAFLDGLMHYRRAQGLVGLSINWGPWKDLGFSVTAGAQRIFRHMQERGMKTLATQQALEALELGMKWNAVQMAVADIDWQGFLGERLLEQSPAFLAHMVAELQSPTVLQQAMQVDPLQIRQELEAIAPEQRCAHLEGGIREILSQVLHMDATQIDPLQPFSTLGLDSIMGIEVKRRLERRLGLTLSTTIIWNYPTVSILATYLAGKLGVSLTSQASPVAVSPVSIKDSAALDRAFGVVESLSEDEALQALMQGN